MESLASAVVTGLGAYLALGLVFAVAFVLRGVDRIDPAAREGTWGFRLLAVPGSAAFWPLLLLRWMRGARPPEERTAHRLAARQVHPTSPEVDAP